MLQHKEKESVGLCLGERRKTGTIVIAHAIPFQKQRPFFRGVNF